jgi:peptidoglycan/LPS O-acetylase OafA/YrhL
MERIVALDGLRGIAVLAVLASHAFAFAAGGFVGVDVFFVLSGYLITSLLLVERARTGHIDVPAFYRRRIARLAPAYLLMLAVATPIMAGPLAGAARWPLAAAVGATATYVANWACVVDVDALGPVIHTWSLAIEEQFYLLWPAAFIGLSRSRRSPVRWLSAGLAVIVVARAGGWLLAPGVWPYFDTVTHADGLLAGCLLAVLLAGKGETEASPASLRRSRAAAAAGIAVLAAIAATLDVDSSLTYLAGLTLAVAGTVAVVRHLVLHPGGRLSRVLRWAPLAFVGRISYGLYLFHMPLFQLVQHYRLGFAPTALGEFGATFALAVASWFLLERPTLTWAHRTRSTFNRARRLVVPVLPS